MSQRRLLSPRVVAADLLPSRHVFEYYHESEYIVLLSLYGWLLLSFVRRRDPKRVSTWLFLSHVDCDVQRVMSGRPLLCVGQCESSCVQRGLVSGHVWRFELQVLSRRVLLSAGFSHSGPLSSGLLLSERHYVS